MAIEFLVTSMNRRLTHAYFQCVRLGLIMVGCDAPKIQAYFIPSLGPAPRWCHFLEGLTEELEEAAPTVYDDYRYVGGERELPRL